MNNWRILKTKMYLKTEKKQGKDNGSVLKISTLFNSYYSARSLQSPCNYMPDGRTYETPSSNYPISTLKTSLYSETVMPVTFFESSWKCRQFPPYSRISLRQVGRSVRREIHGIVTWKINTMNWIPFSLSNYYSVYSTT